MERDVQQGRPAAVGRGRARDEEIDRVFLQEARSHVGEIDRLLRGIGEGAPAREGLGAVAGAFHGVKGAAGFLGREPAVEIAHEAEAILEGLRTPGGVPAPDRIRLLGAFAAALDALLAPPAGGRCAPGAGVPVAPVAALGPLATGLAEAVRGLEGGIAPRVAAAVTRLEAAVTRLEAAAWKASTCPLQPTFEALRELALSQAETQGLRVQVVLDGGLTEVARPVAQGLLEPLSHLVRNALAHGLEPGPERRARGKPEVAQLRICGRRDGLRVRVEVADDGRGIDLDGLRRQAGSTPNATAAGANGEGFPAPGGGPGVDLVFVPGLSTAGRVEVLAGRGLGMGAVREAVDRLGGRVEIVSEPNRGTAVAALLPGADLPLRGLPVQAAARHFVLPEEAVVALVPPGETPGGAGDLTPGHPVRNLARHLGIPPTGTGPASGAGSGAVVVVASGAGGSAGRRAFEIDRWEPPRHLIFSTLAPACPGPGATAGCAVLGDGSLALLLDPARLVA